MHLYRNFCDVHVYGTRPYARQHQSIAGVQGHQRKLNHFSHCVTAAPTGRPTDLLTGSVTHRTASTWQKIFPTFCSLRKLELVEKSLGRLGDEDPVLKLTPFVAEICFNGQSRKGVLSQVVPMKFSINYLSSLLLDVIGLKWLGVRKSRGKAQESLLLRGETAQNPTWFLVRSTNPKYQSR